MGTRLPNYGNETSQSLVLLLYCIWRAADPYRITYESSSTERSKQRKQANKETKKWIVDFERLVSYPHIALYPGLPPCERILEFNMKGGQPQPFGSWLLHRHFGPVGGSLGSLVSQGAM